MTIFKRTFTSIYARIDHMVGEIENHDALIAAAIKEQKQKITAAKVQLRKVESSEQRIVEQLAQLSINVKRWTQRAASEASGEGREANEQQALLCLQRRQGIAKQKQKLQLMRDEYRSSRQRMKKDIGHCEEELINIMQKHQVMRARQSTAEAMQIIERSNGASLEDIENSFDRWEVNIAQGEYSVDRVEESFDELEQEYLEEENEQQLRYELAELLKENALNEQAADSSPQGGAL